MAGDDEVLISMFLPSCLLTYEYSYITVKEITIRYFDGKYCYGPVHDTAP